MNAIAYDLKWTQNPQPGEFRQSLEHAELLIRPGNLPPGVLRLAKKIYQQKEEFGLTYAKNQEPNLVGENLAP